MAVDLHISFLVDIFLLIVEMFSYIDLEKCALLFS